MLRVSPRLVLLQWAFWCWWPFTVQKKRTTSYWWLHSTRREECACMYVNIGFAPSYGTKSNPAFLCCLCKSKQCTLHWSWIWGGRSIAALGLDNQCMARIPLREKTLSSQLIINSIFFMLAGVEAGGGQPRVNGAIVSPSCPCWKLSALWLVRPDHFCCHSVQRK